MIKSELIELIEHLESEQKILEDQKSDCLRQMDYEGAHHFSVALGELNRQLRILYNLNDPYYDEKKTLERHKLLFDIKIPGIDSEQSKRAFAERRKQIDEQIAELNKKVPEQKPDGQEFDDAIYDVIEKKINGFKLHLKKENNFYLEFSLKDVNTLSITTSPLDLSEDNYEMLELVQKLPTLEFIYKEETNTMECLYDLTNFKNSFQIKVLVSRIIFDFLYYKNIDNPTAIEKY